VQQQQRSSPAVCSDLPHELLVCMLRHVELPLRLGRCSLVCRAWHAAAADATSSVAVHPLFQGSDVTTEAGRQAGSDHSTQMLQRCSAWLAKKGAAVTHLSLTHRCQVKYKAHLKLPCDQLQQLQSLSLTNVWLQQPPPSSCSHHAAMHQQRSHQQPTAAREYSSSSAAAADASSTLVSAAAAAALCLRSRHRWPA
jgi:hypothetical protein